MSSNNSLGRGEKASPKSLPWYTAPGSSIICASFPDGETRQVAITHNFVRPQKEERSRFADIRRDRPYAHEINAAHAEFIVRACNNHDQLVEALEEVQDTILVIKGAAFRELTQLEEQVLLITNAALTALKADSQGGGE